MRPQQDRRSEGDRIIATTVRRDIQGLRAVAVVLVIADHLIGRPSGGFIGVDVFFVLSGFLITGLLIRERERTGRISFRGFYVRRARRILPVAALVLLVTVAASWLVFRTDRALQTTFDGLWSLFFAGNWRFAAVGTDYMQAGLPVSPVQHYWSLAVEEQFYLAWPWLLLLAFWIATRFGRAPRAVLAVVFAVAIVGSLVWAFHEVDTARTVAYFSTFSRAWELGVGALLAVGSIQLARLPDWLRPALAWGGIVILAISAVVVDRESAFPAPWAVPAVIASALIIAAGTGGRQRFLWPLTNPISRYLGDISYSLYLWHFPVIIVLGLFFPATSRWFLVLSLALTLGLSVASYHLVENPIRRSHWLEPRAVRSASPAPRAPRARIVAQAVGGVAVLALIVAAAVPISAAGRTAAAPSPTVDGGDFSEQSLAAALEEGTTLTSWPEKLSPSIDELQGSLAPEWIVDDCLNVDDDNLDSCSYGDPDAPKLAVLLGDSVGISWMPALREGLVPSGWRIQSLTMGECPAVDVDATRFTADSFTEECAAHHAWTTEKVAQLQPDLVILASAGSTLLRLASGNTEEAAIEEWADGTATTLSDLRAVTPSPLIVLSSPPTSSNPQTCATRVNGPKDCLGTPEQNYDGMVAAEEAAVSDANGTYQISTLAWFCTVGRLCPPVAGTVPTYADTTHPTAAFSRLLGPLLAEKLLAISARQN